MLSLVLAALIMGLSGWVQGVSGFGFAIVAMSLLPLPFVLPDFQVVFTLVALNSILIPFLVMTRHHREFGWRQALPLTAGGILGTFGGFWMMDRLSGEDVFFRIFGTTLIGFAIVDIYLTRVVRTNMPGWMGVPCGVFGGFFGGAFNIGGPPLVAYAYSQPWSKAQIVATLQFAFICSTAVRLVLMGGHGYFDRHVLTLFVLTSIPTVAGILWGTHLLARLDRDKLKAAVFAVVAVLGFKYLLFGA